MSTHSNIHNCITGYPDAVSLATTRFENDLVLRGRYFGITKVIQLAGGAKEQTIAVIGQTKLLVGFLNFSATGDTIVTARMNPVVTDNGTPLNAVNLNGTSSLVPDTQLFLTPTLSAPGSFIGQWLVPGGTGLFATGGVNSSVLPFVLPPANTYLLEFENLDSMRTRHFNFQFNFFESVQNPEIKR